MTANDFRTGRSLLAAGLLALATAPAALADGGEFLEANGLVAIHMESHPPVGWTYSTSTSGYTGDGYFRWDGPNYFGTPAVEGHFGFDIVITNPGTYTLYIRNRHENPDPTEENDVWVRMDNHPWEKVFSNNYTTLPYVGFWTWESRVEHGTAPQQSYYLSAGLHRIEFSARSHGFKMDRVHLARPGQPNATNENVAESVRRVGTKYGTATNNSAGLVGQLEGRGSSFVQFNDLSLYAFNVPSFTPGVFLSSRSQGFQANPGGSNGNLLLGNSFGRFGSVVRSDSSGRVTMPVDLRYLPVAGGTAAAQVGETWYFQFLHREPGSTNLTRGLSITFE